MIMKSKQVITIIVILIFLLLCLELYSYDVEMMLILLYILLEERIFLGGSCWWIDGLLIDKGIH